MSAPLDLGSPAVESGRCPRCRLDERPLWAVTNDPAGDLACASCMTQLFPNTALTFHSSVAVETVVQPTLL